MSRGLQRGWLLTMRQYDGAFEVFLDETANNYDGTFINPTNINPGGTPGGDGVVYFDNIQLLPAGCHPERVKPLADIAGATGVGTGNYDCRVDYWDLDAMVADWLFEAVQPIDANLVLYYEFENNLLDSSASGFNGIEGSEPNTDISYAASMSGFGQALELDGDQDYVDVGNRDALNFSTVDWSICAWIRTTQSGTGEEDKGTIFANGGDGGGGIRYTLAVGETGGEGTLVLTTDDDVTKVQAISPAGLVNDDEWHHVIGLRSGDEIAVYVDGLLEDTEGLPADYNLAGTSQHNALIGAIWNHGTNTIEKYYDGLIDELRIYDYALSQAEIVWFSGLGVDLHGNDKKIDFKDYAVLADGWLDEKLWPEW